jgi:hypothetical protein
MNARRLTVLSTLLGLMFSAALGALPRAVQAQPEIGVTLPEIEPNPGQTVTLSVEADLDGAEVDSYSGMEFVFNSSALTIEDVKDGRDLSFGTNNFISNVSEDTLRVSNIANSPVTGSGEFLRIDVQLAEGAGTPFSLVPSNTEGAFPTSVFVDADGNNLEIESIDQGRVGELAEAQVIHNAADPAAQTVDVYLDGTLAVDNLSFREATPFVDRLASGVGIDVGVAPSTSNGPGDIIASQTVTLTAGKAHTVVANGVLTPGDFAPNPDGASIGFEFFAAGGADSTAAAGEVGLRAVHGATDAPTVDIDEGGTTLLDNLAYGDVTTNYLSVEAEEKLLAITPADSDAPVAAFQADLSGLGGTAATVLASGFLDPAANQGGPGFALIAALPNGDVVTFPLTIQQARQNGPGTTVTVEGVVTRAYGSYVRLQDESGPTGASGLVVRQTSDNSLASAFRGDIASGDIDQGVRLRLSGTLSESNGLLRINNQDLTDYGIQVQEGLPPAQDVSLSDLQAPDGEDYESELLRIENLTFANPDTTGGTFEAGTTYFVEGTNGTSFPFRVKDDAETNLIDTPIPTGPFTYEGVLGQNQGTYQLIPVRPSTALPVEWAGIDAVQTESGAVVRWQTAAETGNAGFRVQHRGPESGPESGPEGGSESDSWTRLGFVESKAPGGTSTEGRRYRFAVRRALAPGVHRFRLEQVDLDGGTHRSDPVVLEVSMQEALTVSAPSPNPARGQASLRVAVREEAEVTAVLYNMLGQRVRTVYRGTPQAGEAERLVVETGDLSSGVYVLQVRAGGERRTRRLTVVR